jgi:type IV pilus assembly protein PilF
MYWFILCIILFGITGCVVTQKQSVNKKSAAQYNVELGLGYLEEKQTARAQEKLLQALKEAPNLPEVQTSMGYFLLKTGKTAQAKVYYARALKLAPHKGEVLNHYGVFLCTTGHYRQATQYFAAAAKDKNYIHATAAYQNAALCALKIPDKKLADKYFKMAK